MDPILQDMSPPALVRAIDDSLAQAYLYLAGTARGYVRREPDMVRFITGVPHAMMNGVVHPRLARASVDVRIEETLAWFEARHAPMIWWLGPFSQPPDLGPTLQGHGLTHAEGLPGMAADIDRLRDDRPSPRGLVVERVSDAESLRHWAEAFAISFEVEDWIRDAWVRLIAELGMEADHAWRNYVALLDGRPVGTSALYLGAGVAGIYCVGTIHEARGRGIARAMTLAPLREARADGYRIGILHATPMGLPVYERLGFQEYCRFEPYVWKGRREA